MLDSNFLRSKTAGIQHFMNESKKLSLKDILIIASAELNRNQMYAEAWALSEQKVLEEDPSRTGALEFGGRLGIGCYTARKCVSGDFNKLCRTATCGSWDDFRFKSLWYLLILFFLQTPVDVNLTSNPLYRGVSWFPANATTFVFKQFTSATREKSIAKRFLGNNSALGSSLLIIEGLPPFLAREIFQHSFKPDLREVLIWPLATFSVTFLGEEEQSQDRNIKCYRLTYEGTYSSPPEMQCLLGLANANDVWISPVSEEAINHSLSRNTCGRFAPRGSRNNAGNRNNANRNNLRRNHPNDVVVTVPRTRRGNNARTRRASGQRRGVVNKKYTSAAIVVVVIIIIMIVFFSRVLF